MAATLSFSPFSLDRPKKLKDFLQETNGNGKPKTAPFKAIHAVVVAAVRRISFPILPRSLSRRLSGKREREIGGDFVVKVKDIIRWRSFRDSADESFRDSPDYTAAGTTTTTTATSSNCSSWCESDFTAEDLLSPPWRGCSDDGGDGEVGKKYFLCVGVETTTEYEENDRKVNNAFSRRNDKEEEQTVLEERAGQLLEHVKETNLLSENCGVEDYRHLDWQSLKLFQRELTDYSQENEVNEKRVKNNEKNSEEDENRYGWFLSGKGKDAYLREMEKEGKWGVFGFEEKVELGLEIEEEILGCLVDDILLDIFQL